MLHPIYMAWHQHFGSDVTYVSFALKWSRRRGATLNMRSTQIRRGANMEQALILYDITTTVLVKCRIVISYYPHALCCTSKIVMFAIVFRVYAIIRYYPLPYTLKTNLYIALKIAWFEATGSINNMVLIMTTNVYIQLIHVNCWFTDCNPLTSASH